MGEYVAMGAREDFGDRYRRCASSPIIPMILGCLAGLLLVCPIFYWPLRWSEDSDKFPEYTVAVAGFNGLDPDRDILARATLDPSFELTLRIREPRRWSVECVARDTRASVSYQGVLLAGGAVPEFCGGKENSTVARSMMAWGNAVPVPRFARNRLAEELRRGDATVDVVLKGPGWGYMSRSHTVVECRAGLGHGEASPGCKMSTQETPLPPYNPSGMIGPSGMIWPSRKVLRSPQ